MLRFWYAVAMTVKVRIAPSPTGNLHVGTAQSALFNWLFARHNNGQVILRFEDTDTERSRKEYETNITESLQWLGLDWDNTQMYRASERTAVYGEYLQKLLDTGKAVWREYSEQERAEIEREGRPARDRVIVLKDDGDPERPLTFNDMIRGPVTVLAKNIGQLIIAKSIEEPLYHFQVVIDDIDMKISHVIRGEDHISNTPKHMLLYEALGAPVPLFAHLPLLLAQDRSKLSKRKGSVSISEYQKDYLPEALLNFLGTMSYTYEPEILTLEEMVRQFDLSKVHKSGAVFDIEKLNWFNAQYIKRMPPAQFKELIGKPNIPDAAVVIMTERLERLSDISEFEYLWAQPAYDGGLLLWGDDDTSRAKDALQKSSELTSTKRLTQQALDDLAKSDFDGKKGSVYWPLRIALSGRRNSAAPLEIASVIGEKEVLKRIEHALSKLK